jgi:hypothetical protein
MKKLFVPALGMILLTALLFVSCQKELSVENGGSIVNSPGTPILPATPVTGSVTGIVVDENNTPVINAAVKVAGTTYFTDSRGFFKTGKHSLDKYISTVEVNRSGYFKAIRSFCANATRNYVRIKLIPKTLAGSFSSGTAGSVSLSNGTKLSFAANSVVVKATGAPYTGTVKVFSVYINPDAADISALVPGSFIGQDATKMYSLSSAGMLATELESDAGVPLQLATGSPASVKLLIPASLQGNAPASIDTWSLDARGVWIKEGTAARNGNFYVMQVSHFSYWNCDIPNSSIYLSLHVTDQGGQPLSNTYVDIRPTSANLWSHCGGLTDSLGNGTAFVPANEVLQLGVYPLWFCGGGAAYTQNIGPYSTNANVNITATINAVSQILVSGNAVNCAGSPVQAGTATIYYGQYGYKQAAIVNGNYSLNIYSCAPVSSVDVMVADHTTQQQGNITTVAVTGNTANAGSLAACGTSTLQFINYTVDGVNYQLQSANPATDFYGYVSQVSFSTLIAAVENGTTNTIGFTAIGTAVGTFPLDNDSLSINTYYGALKEPGASATFTSFGGLSGQYLEGNFNIPFTHFSTGATVHTCTGTFRVKRW